ncbi:MAG: radical SAM protein [Treponema sp.]|nr:radical SAM protein [Treponema sp.]
MKNILIISFDTINNEEYPASYSIASLLASLKSDTSEKMNIVHWPFNTLENDFEQKLYNKLKLNNINQFERIAISVFVWSELIVRKLLESEYFINYRGIIILGGRQIIGEENNLINDYPRCKIFVIGYGENIIKDAISMNIDKPKFLYGNSKDLNFPSPYLTNELSVLENQKMVRMETKRGCPYSCDFCAHRDLTDNKVYDFPYDRIKSELDLFKQKRVEKINIIDPIFNFGNEYLNILDYIYNNKINSKISLQARFEQIKGENGRRFIDMCGKLNIVLEFGVQSLIEKEYNSIGRENDIENITRIVKDLNKKGIDYEISIIYGLPEQSPKTFQETIDRLASMECKSIKAYPLMLLKGTKLYKNKEKWNLKEKIFENIPLVIESNSFSEKEWEKMKKIAEQFREK